MLLIKETLSGQLLFFLPMLHLIYKNIFHFELNMIN